LSPEQPPGETAMRMPAPGPPSASTIMRMNLCALGVMVNAVTLGTFFQSAVGYRQSGGREMTVYDCRRPIPACLRRRHLRLCCLMFHSARVLDPFDARPGPIRPARQSFASSVTAHRLWRAKTLGGPIATRVPPAEFE